MSPSNDHATKARGRPRSEDSRRAIVRAVWQMMLAGPIRTITIEGVAKQAGVGKTTIYRWWPSRPALLCDAFLESLDADLGFRQHDSFAQTLREQFTILAQLLAGDVGRVVRELLAENTADPQARRLFADRFIQPRRDAARRVIEQAIEAGEFRQDLDPEFAMDVLYGPIYFRLLVGHAPLDPDFLDRLPDTAMRGLFV